MKCTRVDQHCTFPVTIILICTWWNGTKWWLRLNSSQGRYTNCSNCLSAVSYLIRWTLNSKYCYQYFITLKTPRSHLSPMLSLIKSIFHPKIINLSAIQERNTQLPYFHKSQASNHHSSSKYTSANPRGNTSKIESMQSPPPLAENNLFTKINPPKHGHLPCSHHFRKRGCLGWRQIRMAFFAHSTGAVSPGNQKNGGWKRLMMEKAKDGFKRASPVTNDARVTTVRCWQVLTWSLNAKCDD